MDVVVPNPHKVKFYSTNAFWNAGMGECLSATSEVNELNTTYSVYIAIRQL